MSTVPTTFKAYEYINFGDPLDEMRFNSAAPKKPLQAGEVRVKVMSAAVNPVDYKLIQHGAVFQPTSPSEENPFRMGLDVAGTVVELGSDVKDYKVGDDVFAMAAITASGSFAEYMNVDMKVLAPKPSNMTFNEAAGVPLASQTSFQCLTNYGKLQAGQRVLILGGSTACGLFGIQIAKALGAEVIATCSSRNAELVKSVGADQVIDYTTEKWCEVLAEHSVDLIYDCGVEAASWNDVAQKVLKEKTGIFVTIFGTFPLKDPVESPIGATLHQMMTAPSTESLLEIKKLVEAGQLKTIIDSVHSLENVKEAIKMQMSGHAQGKIIIEVCKE